MKSNFVVLVFTSLFAAIFLYLPCAKAATKVEIVKPRASSHQQILRYTGTVETTQQAQLPAQQAGLVAEIYVDVGDQVTTGQKLVALDSTLAKLNLAETQASLSAVKVNKTEAERLYNEVITLSKQRLVAQTLIGQRRAAVARAKAELAKQQAGLAVQQEIVKRHTLTAPFDGIISNRNANLGEWVNQQTGLLTLVSQQNLRLKINIPQEYLTQLRTQQPIAVTVTPDLVNAKAIQAQIGRLVTVSNQQSRTFSAYIYLPNSQELAVGMSAQAELTLEAATDELVWLPKTAVKQHPDGGYSVFAVINNKAKRYLVNQIKTSGNQVAVSGAPSEYSYVASGIELLVDGTEVTAKGL